MNRHLFLLTFLICAAPAAYALADGPEPATAKKTATDKPDKEPAHAKEKAKKSSSDKDPALDEEKARALAADLALTDFSSDSSLSSDRRIRVLMYDESDVYTITTRYGYQTNIVFAPNESIETISVGDRSMWQIIPAANRMFIRPMEENVTTNMTVLTNKRSYQFDLKSIGADKGGSNIYVAKFSYPEDMPPTPPIMMQPPVRIMPMPVAAPAPPVAYEPPPAAYEPPAPLAPSEPSPAITGNSGPGVTQPVHPNYNYSYTGPDDLAPLQVYDDGKSTFVKYRTPHPPFPKVFAVAASGEEEQVNYTVRSDMMVIDHITDKLFLRNGQDTVVVYNEMLTPR